MKKKAFVDFNNNNNSRNGVSEDEHTSDVNVDDEDIDNDDVRNVNSCTDSTNPVVVDSINDGTINQF